ncbi:hypothetical protein TNCT_485681 [Trichonephila clavata]|uniref:Uncharacterized protein n=1 Tax=Trichonephila clavata TaxID=2740835 RepID=A0A8X6IAL3_TRICU|nr:hypothetical protein TNCT_485681 [Trichonephila clavata]
MLASRTTLHLPTILLTSLFCSSSSKSIFHLQLKQCQLSILIHNEVVTPVDLTSPVKSKQSVMLRMTTESSFTDAKSDLLGISTDIKTSPEYGIYILKWEKVK